MAFFNLIHMSDLHFGYRANRVQDDTDLPDIEAPKRHKFHSHDKSAIDAICLQVGTIVGSLPTGDALDGVIVTGDLGTMGFTIDLMPARNFLEKELLAHIDPAKQPKLPKVFIMPGNHDRYERKGLAGNVDFEHVFDNHGWPKPVPSASSTAPRHISLRRSCWQDVFTKIENGREVHLGIVAYDFSPLHPSPGAILGRLKRWVDWGGWCMQLNRRWMSWSWQQISCAKTIQRKAVFMSFGLFTGHPWIEVRWILATKSMGSSLLSMRQSQTTCK